MSDDDSFIYAGDAIKTLFDKILPSAAKEYSYLSSGWEKIVGKEISFHVVPADIVNGTLILQTDHPGWVQRIKMMREKILKSINKHFPEAEIYKISVQISKYESRFNEGK